MNLVRDRSGQRARIRRAVRFTAPALAALGTMIFAAGCSELPPRSTDGTDVAATKALLPNGPAAPHPIVLLARSTHGTSLTQVGTAEVTTAVVSLSGGRVRPTSGPEGTLALRMPAFTTSSDYPRAVIKVENSGATDPLSPGTAPFAWGADFRLDARSTDPVGVDNGDNLIQRGLWGEPAEYKAEVDMDRGGCTATGSDGSITVRTREQIRPGVWYRMRCIRQAQNLTVRVTQLGTGGDTTSLTARKTGPIGSIEMERRVPLAIGGKLARDGSMIKSATDQFNGAIAYPILELVDQ